MPKGENPSEQAARELRAAQSRKRDLGADLVRKQDRQREVAKSGKPVKQENSDLSKAKKNYAATDREVDRKKRKA